jgi:hypothetical protein
MRETMGVVDEYVEKKVIRYIRVGEWVETLADERGS